MKRVFAVLVLLGGVGFAKTPGESGAVFLRLEDLQGLSKNPAGLVKMERSGSFMYSIPLNEVEGLKFTSANITYPLREVVIGASILYYGYGEMDEYNNLGTKTGGIWSANDLCISLSYAKKVFGASFGGSIKAIQSKIDDKSGNAFAIDIGAIYELPKVSLGVNMKNMGTKIKYEKEKAKLPLSLNICAISDIPTIVKVWTELVIPNDNSPYLSLGIEKGIGMVLALKAGYSSRKASGPGIFGGFDVLKFPVCFSYNYVPYGDLGDSHMISLRVKF